MKIISLIVITFLFCCTTQISENKDVGTTNAQHLQKDFHTTYTDVIDNFFVAINSKDWKIADSFYADTLAQKSAYFKNILEKNQMHNLTLIDISKKNDTVYTITKNADSIIRCFNFIIINNRITYQDSTACRN